MAVLRYGGQDFDISDEEAREFQDAMTTALSEGRSYWLQLAAGQQISSILISTGVPVSISRGRPVDNTMYEAPDESPVPESG